MTLRLVPENVQSRINSAKGWDIQGDTPGGPPVKLTVPRGLTRIKAGIVTAGKQTLACQHTLAPVIEQATEWDQRAQWPALLQGSVRRWLKTFLQVNTLVGATSKITGELTPSLKDAIITTEPESEPTLVVSMFWSYWLGCVHAADISDIRFFGAAAMETGQIFEHLGIIPTDTDDSVPKIPGQYLKSVNNTRRTFSGTYKKLQCNRNVLPKVIHLYACPIPIYWDQPQHPKRVQRRIFQWFFTQRRKILVIS
ncbi:hypothetical protein TEQG_01717 [Trichophyton equinum CBS 127.97]|uniref:Uncharacterized protein n=1 Tax=Trichophyton equinum (strain ATCC MYA-4606 / CBS 127.97) TaxID=559882 RepID=F2PL84_TRIEC|nr:hypothetical protein TEQG_01717 [Trichophyton equinum CBS 127.97]